MSILDRPQRPNVADAEWRISVELVRGDQVLERSDAPLRISDAQLNGHFDHNAKNIGRWIDDLAHRRSRNEAAAKKASKPRAKRR